MDDESSVSSKSECLKALESRELRVWLSHHNKNISKRYEHHEQNEKQRKNLLAGLQSEENPEIELSKILNLALPRTIRKNGKVVDVAQSSVSCNKAFHNMLQDSSLHARHESGVHPVTLLTEQRRKIVLNALTDFGYLEDRKVSQSKLTDLLNNDQHNDEEPSLVVAPKPKQKLTPIPEKHTHHSSDSQASRFKPKWEDYTTMKARWTYIEPQVRRLVHDQQVIAPQTSQGHMAIDNNTTIHGHLNDIHHFGSVRSKKSDKQRRISQHGEKLERQRVKALNTYYIPSPCVKY